MKIRRSLRLVALLMTLSGTLIGRGDWAITNDFAIDLDHDDSADFNLRHIYVDRHVFIPQVPLSFDENIARAELVPGNPAWELMRDANVPDYAVGLANDQTTASRNLVWTALPAILFESSFSVPDLPPPPPPPWQPPRLETGYFQERQPRWVLVRHRENEQWRYGWIGFRRLGAANPNAVEFVGAELSETLDQFPLMAPRTFSIKALSTGLRITWSRGWRNAHLQRSEGLHDPEWVAVPNESPGEALVPYDTGGFFRVFFEN